MRSAAASLSQFIGGVDVPERFGLVVERDLDGLECSVPGVDLAPATLEKLRQMRQDGLAHQREHRMRLVEGTCDCEIGLASVKRGRQTRDQVCRQKWRIAGHGR